MNGYHVLGATHLGVDAGDLAAVVRLKNLDKLIQEQGGATGTLAYNMLPGTVKSEVYKKFRDKLLEGFKQQGVDADVQITYNPPVGEPPPPDFIRGMAAGAGTVGLGWVIWRFLIRGLIFKR